jgi:hypothetical protein
MVKQNHNKWIDENGIFLKKMIKQIEKFNIICNYYKCNNKL